MAVPRGKKRIFITLDNHELARLEAATHLLGMEKSDLVSLAIEAYGPVHDLRQNPRVKGRFRKLENECYILLVAEQEGELIADRLRAHLSKQTPDEFFTGAELRAMLDAAREESDGE